MIFNNYSTPEEILKFFENELKQVKEKNSNFEILIRPIKPKRSVYQNRFLMVVLNHIIDFYHTSGFIPKGLSSWAMQAEILKEYFKAYFGIESTSKLSKADFVKFVDSIQFEMVIQSNGEYQIIQIEDENYTPEKYERIQNV